MLKEDRYPVDASGRPDLRYYKDSTSYYYDMLVTAHTAIIKPGADAKLEFSRRVHGSWGLIAQGIKAVPHAVRLLRSKNAEMRQDGAGILGSIGNSETVSELTRSLAAETDAEAKDTLLMALGSMKNQAAIQAVASVILNESEDAETRWTAMESLGQIVRKRFVKAEAPIDAAVEWLSANGYSQR